MKKYIAGLIMAVLGFIAMLPLQALAAQKGRVCLEVKENNTADVSVIVPEAAGEQVSSLQLGLQITDQDGNSVGQEVLDQIESPAFVWRQEILANAKITEQRYQRETGILRLYISGAEPLFTAEGEDRDTLALGTVTAAVKDEESLGMTIYMSMAADSLKIVRGEEAVPVPVSAMEAVPIISGKTPAQPPSPGDKDEKPGEENPGDGEERPGEENPGDGNGNPGDEDENPGEEEKPGEDSQNPGNGNPPNPGTSGNGSGNSGGTSNQPGTDKSKLREILDLAAGYRETDYTWESYRLLKQAVREGRAVLDDPNAAQEEVDRAIQAIQNAIGALVPAAAAGTDTRYDQNTLHGSQNQAVGTGDVISWKMCVLVMIFGAVLLTGAGMWKKIQKRI